MGLGLGDLPARTRPILAALPQGLRTLKWRSPPRNIFIAKKDLDSGVLDKTRSFAQHLHKNYDVNILAEEHVSRELDMREVRGVEPSVLREYSDLIVTIGGDGTILRAAALFKQVKNEIPPVLNISMGTLGFLLPFNFADAPEAFSKVYNSQSIVMERSRLAIRLPKGGTEVHAINDLTIHRGSSPHLAQLDIAVNGQHVTTAIADGVTVSTPTGSTAYSLSSGGSIVHPGVRCVLLTPICPRSLSFRPLIFPETSEISISVNAQARDSSRISIDGSEGPYLGRGDNIVVSAHSNEGLWCVARESETRDWVCHLNDLLGFNSKFGVSH